MNRLISFIKIVLINFPVHIIMLVTSILPNLNETNKFRGLLLRPFFKSCGKNLQIASGVTFIQIKNIDIGDNVYIAHRVWINGSGGLKIASRVIISPMVVIATTKHAYIDGCISNHLSEKASISIGEGTWIASNSVVTKGVTIGRGCIVGACSSVTKDIPDYHFAGGVPAKIIKKLI